MVNGIFVFGEDRKEVSLGWDISNESAVKYNKAKYEKGQARKDEMELNMKDECIKGMFGKTLRGQYIHKIGFYYGPVIFTEPDAHSEDHE